VAVYFIIVFVQDLQALKYGQAGARRDWVAQYWKLWEKSRNDALTADPSRTPREVERQLDPFTEGYMARLNWSAYQAAMLKKGVVVSGDPSPLKGTSGAGYPYALKVDGATFPGTDTAVTADLLWHLNWYLDRGKVIGWAFGMRGFTSPADFDSLFQLSRSSEWVLDHCPPQEAQKVIIDTADELRGRAMAIARIADTPATEALGITVKGVNAPDAPTTPEAPVTSPFAGVAVKSPEPAPAPAPVPVVQPWAGVQVQTQPTPPPTAGASVPAPPPPPPPAPAVVSGWGGFAKKV
jgi:hypothetical protein